ncbi:type II 3-dehydroquinate dehydratase [Candidatus Vidania fulgoroideorum]
MIIKIINGPNINLIGKREPKKYGNKNIYFIKKIIKNKIYKKNIKIIFKQYNSESKIIKEIQKKKCDYFILNLAGLSYYSISILDALLGVKIPFIEVHISNIFKRESIRRKSIISKFSIGFISGMGVYCYYLAVKYIILKNNL